MGRDTLAKKIRMNSIRSLTFGLLIGLLTMLSVPVARAGDASFSFDGAEYFLRGDEAGIREFLTKGETFEKWTTLISIREYRSTDDPRAYAFQLVKNAKASSPNANGQVMENAEAGSYIADFLVFSEEGTEPFFAEWNLWRIEKKGNGLQAVQYARRFYNITEDTAKELNAARQKIVPQLAEVEIPE
jgi:hypothetical protein